MRALPGRALCSETWVVPICAEARGCQGYQSTGSVADFQDWPIPGALKGGVGASAGIQAGPRGCGKLINPSKEFIWGGMRQNFSNP